MWNTSYNIASVNPGTFFDLTLPSCLDARIIKHVWFGVGTEDANTGPTNRTEVFTEYDWSQR